MTKSKIKIIGWFSPLLYYGLYTNTHLVHINMYVYIGVMLFGCFSRYLSLSIQTHIHTAYRGCKVLAILYCVHTSNNFNEIDCSCRIRKECRLCAQKAKNHVQLTSILQHTALGFWIFDAFGSMVWSSYTCSLSSVVFLFQSKPTCIYNGIVNCVLSQLWCFKVGSMLVCHIYNNNITTTTNTANSSGWKKKLKSAHIQLTQKCWFFFVFFLRLFIFSPCYELYVSPRASFNHIYTHPHISAIVLANTFDYACEFFFYEFFLFFFFFFFFQLFAVYFYLLLEPTHKHTHISI